MERASGTVAGLVAQIDHAGAVVRRMREFLSRGEPDWSRLNVKAMLVDALALVRADAAARKISLTLEVDDSLPHVVGDRVQLQQVALNLVHNAAEAIIESLRPDGAISVRARHLKEEGVVEVSVIDNGIGGPAGQSLFEPLSSSKADGLGLGLSICASIVASHGGRIWLQSSVASATELCFSIPVNVKKGSR